MALTKIAISMRQHKILLEGKPEPVSEYAKKWGLRAALPVGGLTALATIAEKAKPREVILGSLATALLAGTAGAALGAIQGKMDNDDYLTALAAKEWEKEHGVQKPGLLDRINRHFM